MKVKMKTCSRCEEEKHIWKNFEGEKYCKSCWMTIKFSEEKPKKKPQKKIQPKSKKQIELDKIYSQLRMRFLERKPLCEAALQGCTHSATDVHHKKGRGRWYLVVSSWMAVCRTCHEWIETHPIEATEKGFRESKITD